MFNWQQVQEKLNERKMSKIKYCQTDYLMSAIVKSVIKSVEMNE